MCDKAVLDEITSRDCAAAKEVLGDKLEKVILFGSLRQRRLRRGVGY